MNNYQIISDAFPILSFSSLAVNHDSYLYSIKISYQFGLNEV